MCIKCDVNNTRVAKLWQMFISVEHETHAASYLCFAQYTNYTLCNT